MSKIDWNKEVKNKEIIDRVLELLYYDKESGSFYWKKKPNRNIIIGSKVTTKNHGGYLVVQIDRKRFRQHHLVYLIEQGILPNKNEIIHHLDERKDNNFIENLKLMKRAKHSSDHGHTRKRKTKSFIPGVTKINGKWKSQFTRDGLILQKYFANLFDAICYRKSMENALKRQLK